MSVNNVFSITLDDVEIQVVCEECGAPLDVEYHSRHEKLNVTPCSTCLAEAEEKGHARGVEYAEKEVLP